MWAKVFLVIMFVKVLLMKMTIFGVLFWDGKVVIQYMKIPGKLMQLRHS